MLLSKAVGRAMALPQQKAPQYDQPKTDLEVEHVKITTASANKKEWKPLKERKKKKKKTIYSKEIQVLQLITDTIRKRTIGAAKNVSTHCSKWRLGSIQVAEA